MSQNQREKPDFVNLGNARFDDQLEVMKEIKKAGICPFCPENRERFPLELPVWEGTSWVLVPNRWPYEFTQFHLIAVSFRHIETMAELNEDELLEFWQLLKWVEKQYNLESYSIGIRCGNPAKNGGSVRHLHVQLIVADQNTAQPGYKKVRFPMGPKPPA